MNVNKTVKNSEAGIQLVTFRLGEEHYGIPVSKVKEIIRPIDSFPIPGMSGPVEGVINLRGEIIPVLKIHSVLGVRSSEESGAQRKRRTIILDTEEGGFGFVVDEVMDVVRVAREGMKPAPDVGIDAGGAGSITGIVEIGGRMIICLEPERIVAGSTGVESETAEMLEI